MLSGKLFRNGIILLDKLNLRTVYRNVTAAMQIYDFLCHTVFLYIYLLSIQLSHCHIYPQRFYTALYVHDIAPCNKHRWAQNQK